MRITLTAQEAKQFNVFADQDIMDALRGVLDLIYTRESLILDNINVSEAQLRALQGKKELIDGLKRLDQEILQARTEQY